MNDDALRVIDGLGETALHKIVRRAYDKSCPEIDYYKCTETLLEKGPFMDTT